MPGHNICAFRGCHSKEGEGISLFKFPNDTERARRWIESCFRTDLLSKGPNLKNYKLCEMHFDSKFIKIGAVRKKLLPGAIPTIFLPEQGLLDITEISPRKMIVSPDKQEEEEKIIIKCEPPLDELSYTEVTDLSIIQGNEFKKVNSPDQELVNQVQVLFNLSETDSPKERLLKIKLQELAEADLVKSKRIRLLENLVWRQKKEIEQLKK